MDRRKIKEIPLTTTYPLRISKKLIYSFWVSTKLVNMGSRVLLVDIRYDDGRYMRIAFDKKNKDWGDYTSNGPKWRKRYIKTYQWWDRGNDLIWKKDQPDAATYISSADEARIIRYFNNGAKDWISAIDDFQKNIRDTEAAFREKKRSEQLIERHNLLPELPKDFIRWSKSLMTMECIYYTRDRKYMECTCSACGETYTINTGGIYRRADKDLPRRRRFIRGDEVYCPQCGTLCTAKSKNTRKYGYEVKQYFNIGQRYGENGFVFRQIELKKHFNTDSKHSFGIRERARYYSDGYEEYHHEGYFTPDYWSRNMPNMCGNFWTPKDGPTYPETFENIKGTDWQYSQLKEVDGYDKWHVNLWEYLAAYHHDRWLEAMVKLGFGWAVYDRITNYYAEYNTKAKTPYEYLGIYKHRIKDLQNARGGSPMVESEKKLLDAFRIERDLDTHFTMYQCEYIATIDVSRGVITTILNYTTMEKAINYVKKQTESYGTTADTIQHYSDYLHMRSTLGYDMTDTIILYPHNLKEAHDRLVEERESRAADSRKKEKEKEFERIRRRFKKALAAYEWESEDLMIRPARSASEIIDEGRILHHCVGGDGYLEKHANGKSTILFLRNTKHKRTPYVTVEISPDGKIKQWYGAYDRKPDEKHLEKWLEEYTKQLKPKALKAAV